MKNCFPEVTYIEKNFLYKYNSILDSDITVEELNFSISKCKLNKSPGIDGISNEFLIALPENRKLYIVVFLIIF